MLTARLIHEGTMMTGDHAQLPVPPADATPGRRASPPVTARSQVRDILARHGRLSVPVDQLSDTSDLHSAGLTSLATVGLMLALEEHFEVEFPDSLLSRKTFSSIDSLVAAVEGLRTA
jgi:acyl carrier protein